MFHTKFTNSSASFQTNFEKINDVSDGGYERGLAEGFESGKAEGLTEGYAKGETEGFADALDKRTDLVVTENGEYTPGEDSTGFKSVSVNVQFENKLVKVVDKSVAEITAEDLQGATLIGDYSFQNCDNLASVNIPEGVTSIGKYAFKECNKLVSVNIPASVISIGNNAFEMKYNGIGQLSSISFEKNSKLKTIGGNAFRDCRKLTEIIIPSEVTNIGDQAFYYCKGLSRFICLAETPPTLEGNIFYGIRNDLPIFVKPSSVEAYKSATNWSARADYIQALVEEDI